MNVEEIKQEIVKLEQAETNWTNLQRLSWLYSVYDHIGDGDIKIRSTVNVMPELDGEFGKVVSHVPIDGLMNVLSEHMSVVKILYPKEYEAVIDRIKEIR